MSQPVPTEPTGLTSPTSQTRPASGQPGERPAWLPVWAGDLAIIALILVSVVVPTPGGAPGSGLGLPLGPGPGPGSGPGFPDEHMMLLVPLLAVVTAALMPLRRRWSVPVFIACLVMYLATVVFVSPVLAPGIGAVVAVFAAGNTAPRRTALVLGALGATVVAVLSLFTDDRMALDPQVFQVAAGIAVATALGDSARSRREYTRAVTERAERAEQTREAEASRRVAEERLRIAQDLHDTVAHRISVISLNAGVASSSLDTRPEKARESLATIRGAAREVLGDIGVLLRYLRADDNAGTGAEGASVQLPQPGLADIDPLVRSVVEAGLTVDRTVDGDLSSIDETTGRVVYRVVQEGLTNAHKHGSGGSAHLGIVVRGGADAAVTVQVRNPVSDTGRNQPDAPQGHLGLTGLRERVAAVGGTISTVESDGTFTLSAELPLASHTRNREDYP
ncbi:histidine kinase [Corynebacterium sp.]|uniref:sensor histidine kinase n=1 Tax=Corynebacterium sp. TaxID=1720 RepID=UPI0028AE6894|nr:histidine kinase [Corynebacterium sp.]